MTDDKTKFEQVSEEDRISIFSEFLYFLRENKKWWMLPILLVIAAVGLLVAVSASGALPFIYAFF